MLVVVGLIQYTNYAHDICALFVRKVTWAVRHVDAILEDDNSGGMAIQFLSKRLANVRIGNQVLSAKLYDLPAITEVMKTTNRKTIYKVADLSQVMVCSHELCAIPPAEKKLSKKKEAKRWQYPDGLTPPMKSVRKRRFRKTKKKKYMEAPEVERELKRLLRADMESSSFRWEIVDSDGKVVYESDQPCTSVISSTQEGTTVSEGALCERDSFDEHEFSRILQSVWITPRKRNMLSYRELYVEGIRAYNGVLDFPTPQPGSHPNPSA
ncbi:unnamed protein product [Heligmosomoides polygyrus]|uniref:TAFII55_N domain-containing protein n=1 Tax=Heligmosomoides polygyrus TaxID=6339 RepID=A0A3P7ZGR7_HELPZ|nr:unnamed protein product [Heligmosomoides polygyrus]